MAPLLGASYVVAVGEAGLDYYYDYSPRSSQRQAFQEQVRLAAETELPLIVHCRDAWSDCLETLDKHRSPRLKGVIHCFSGGLEEAKAAVRLGFRISFAGNLTFAKAEALRDAARAIPLESLMIETDCPYLAPQPHRGRRNEPAFVTVVASKLATLKGIALEEVAATTRRTAEELFDLPRQEEGNPAIAEEV